MPPKIFVVRSFRHLGKRRVDLLFGEIDILQCSWNRSSRVFVLAMVIQSLVMTIGRRQTEEPHRSGALMSSAIAGIISGSAERRYCPAGPDFASAGRPDFAARSSGRCSASGLDWSLKLILSTILDSFKMVLIFRRNSLRRFLYIFGSGLKGGTIGGARDWHRLGQ